MRSNDHGASWSDPVRIASVTAPVPSWLDGGIQVDGKGRFHLYYTVRSMEYGVYSMLVYIRSVDQGVTWNTPLKIAGSEAQPGVFNQGVSQLAAFTFGDDEVHLTWDEPERRHMWSLDGGNTWSQPVAIMRLGAAFGGVNQLAKDSTGLLHVVSAVGDGVYHATWDGQTWSPPEAIDQRFIDPHHQNLVICQGNELHVVYDDRTGEHEIWYSTKSTQAPQIQREPIPTPQVMASVASTTNSISTTKLPDDRCDFVPRFCPDRAVR